MVNMRRESKFSREEITLMLEKFARDGKAFYYSGYVIIPKWIKHQKIGERSKIFLGALAVLRSLPAEIKIFIDDRKHYDFDVRKYIDIPRDADRDADNLSARNEEIPIGYAENGIAYQENAQNCDRLPQKADSLSHDSDSDSDSDFIKCINSHIQKDDEFEDFENDPKKLFIHLWQQNADVFNGLSRIESLEEYDKFWENGKGVITCDMVRTAIVNFTADIRDGAIKKRYIPSMPDRFVLKGWIQKCQERFKKKDEQAQTGPPLNLKGKKSLGGLSDD
jgi:hypothetical protein